MNTLFTELRQKNKTFSYNGFSAVRTEQGITVTFDFALDGVCEFHPTTTVLTDNLNLLNDFDSPSAKSILFSLGMVELISYWKASCPETVFVRCGKLSEDDVLWWKKLWWGGLGEFFFRNNIQTDFDSFVQVKSEGEEHTWQGCSTADFSLVPIGGGKDSDVTLSLLGERKGKIKCFTVNDQAARTQGVLAAGLSEKDIVRTKRTIAPELLELNRQGYLNGHTPFSAIVGFLGLYCAYLIGATEVILSNESSANEASVVGQEVNHQYSKSYEFEQDLNRYIETHFGNFARYFSLLRCFNELQIAAQFAALKQYHSVFVSCNVGSKKNIWCGHCAKCLFVYIILSPFLSPEELTNIFGSNLLDIEDLQNDFLGLTGQAESKPFECVGTVREVNAALAQTKKQYLARGEKLPLLLRDYEADEPIQPLLNEFNEENAVPDAFLPYAKEMYRYVSSLN
ncbi:MAG TPA: hypothetical protein DDY98_02790 [Ruminococcaceae bacterium]|nr:hypothetical protein [Oscillospiraceae bacterium]